MQLKKINYLRIKTDCYGCVVSTFALYLEGLEFESQLRNQFCLL